MKRRFSMQIERTKLGLQSRRRGIDDPRTALADPETGHIAVSTSDPNPAAGLGMLAMCPGCCQMTSAITNIEINHDLHYGGLGTWTGECGECNTTTTYQGTSHLELHVYRTEKRTLSYNDMWMGETGRGPTFGGRR